MSECRNQMSEITVKPQTRKRGRPRNVNSSSGVVVATHIPADFDTPARLRQLADFVQIEINKCLESKRAQKQIGILIEIKHALHELAQSKDVPSE